MIRCSRASADVAEPLAGTAPRALGWFALEQAGPWGARAFTASHLDPALGAALEARAAAALVRPALIRCPGPHADHADKSRTLLLAHTLPSRTWLVRVTLADPRVVIDLPWEALAEGDLRLVTTFLDSVSLAWQLCREPVLLVCTNGARDTCCALFGRPVCDAAAAVAPGRVWEVTHTGGHRFAPTGVMLPSGDLHGRLDPDGAVAVLEAAGRGETVLATHRGRSSWTVAGQVAELAVRDLVGDVTLDALGVIAESDSSATVRHVDGRQWRVELGRHRLPGVRPESCDGQAVTGLCLIPQRVVPLWESPATSPTPTGGRREGDR